MPFLCLERCGNATSADVARTVALVAANASRYGAVATERYNLGPGGALVRAANLSDSVSMLRAAGWPAHAPVIAMVSSFPYPPAFAAWMREAFADPGQLFRAMASEARASGLAGFNIDWEPLADTLRPGDAQAYAAFLGAAGRAMRAEGLLLTVDIATWSPLWNLTALAAEAAPHLDAVVTMSTYTDSPDTWPKELDRFADAFADAGNLVVGLETARADGSPYPQQQLRRRFDALAARGLRRVALWKAPVPAAWDGVLGSL